MLFQLHREEVNVNQSTTYIQFVRTCVHGHFTWTAFGWTLVLGYSCIIMANYIAWYLVPLNLVTVLAFRCHRYIYNNACPVKFKVVTTTSAAVDILHVCQASVCAVSKKRKWKIDRAETSPAHDKPAGSGQLHELNRILLLHVWTRAKKLFYLVIGARKERKREK